MVTQLSEENVNIVASQGFVINAKQCQVRGEYANEKGNDMECLPSENIIAEGKKVHII